MKLRHVFWVLSGIVAVVAMAAGIAVFIDRYISRKECPTGYLDCGDEEIIIEEYVEQIPELMMLHPSSLNTARIITVLDRSGIPHILCGFLRVGQDGKIVDNGASGGILCQLSENGTILRCLSKTGIDYTSHPNTSVPMVGSQIPHWDSALETAMTLAKHKPTIRFCGWDLALTKNGWIMIEGNESAELTGLQIFGGGCKKRMLKYI